MSEPSQQSAGSREPTLFALVVGAGFGGIGMGVALKRAGIDDFLIVDKAAGPGGVWEANHYPGAACDVPSHLYSFSFEPWSEWSRRYGPQAEIREYLRHCCRRYGLEDHLRLRQTVTGARWDASERVWRVSLASGEVLTARVLIPACGQLSLPAWPAIEGLERFSGPSFHSAEWDHEVDLSGRRVGVIGTGASAIQFVPEVAKDAAQVTIFQRTPPYVFPKFDRAYGAFEQGLYRRFPLLRRVARGLQYLSHEARGLMLLRVRPLVKIYEWRYRWILRRIFRDVGQRAMLWPEHPLGCKRILFSNHYLQALAQDHVQIVDGGVRAVDETGVVAADGTHHDCDVLILGTGFRATEFLAPLEILGRDGARLDERWAGGARAYLGMTVPEFPNLFILYGPNTNLGHNSIIFMLERQIGYLMQAFELLRESADATLEVDDTVAQRFDDEVQAALQRSMWADGCDNWYTDAAGRIVNNWPALTVTYARRTARFDREHYLAHP